MFSFLNRYLKNNSFFFLMAFLMGLLFGDLASVLKHYILPVLVLIMSLSTTKITLSELIHFKKYSRDIFFVFFINYLFLSGLIILANHLLVKDHDLYVGFVVMAAVPSATAVLAFTYLLKGEMMVSLMGSASLYVMALVIAPFLSFQFLEVERIDPIKLASALGQLIILPFIISRILVKWKAFYQVKEHTNTLINSAIFFIIYVVIGINRSTFLSQFGVLALLASIAFLRTFVSGHLVDVISRMAGTDRPRRMSYVLFGSFKNLALASAIAITLFNERAAIPAAVTIPFEILFFIWFNYFQKRWG